MRREIPTPQECGLPEKFDSWRPAQEQAIHFLRRSTKRVKAPCMATGSGKSAVYVMDALLSQEPTVFVTENRGLQTQLMDDFGSIGMVDLRGRRNYVCDLRPGYSCEEGYAARCPHKGTVQCPSSQAEMRAAVSKLVVTNAAKWTSAKKYGQGMGHFTRLVLDEGHNSHNWLADAMQVVLHHLEIEEDLGVNFLGHPEAEDMARWKVWACEARAAAQDRFLRLQQQLALSTNPHPKTIKEFTRLRYLCRRLAILSTARASDWIVEELERGYQFDPIRPGRYVESSLLMKIPNVIITSGTLCPKALFLAGIGQDQFDFIEIPSDFDPARCPIYYVPTMRVDKWAGDLSMLWLLLDQWAARRRDRKGIVQTVSFARQKMGYESSYYADSMIVNPRGEAPTEMIRQYRMSGPGTILVTPSVSSGYDFPMKDCEWQFVCKVPFPPPSKILDARKERDKEYPYYLTMNKLQQIFGRGMRSAQDRCENVIGDDHMAWFIRAYGHLAPASFHRFYKQVKVLPQPPPPL